MRKIGIIICLTVLTGACQQKTPAPLPAKSPRSTSAPAQIEFSDEAVEQAIMKGIEYLWSKQAPDGSWGVQDGHTDRPTALVLSAGHRAQDPRMKKALEWLKTQ